MDQTSRFFRAEVPWLRHSAGRPSVTVLFTTLSAMAVGRPVPCLLPLSAKFQFGTASANKVYPSGNINSPLFAHDGCNSKRTPRSIPISNWGSPGKEKDVYAAGRSRGESESGWVSGGRTVAARAPDHAGRFARPKPPLPVAAGSASGSAVPAGLQSEMA